MVMELSKDRLSSKNQSDNQIKVSVYWQYGEPNPSFKRLMSLLLRKGDETKREVRDDGHKL